MQSRILQKEIPAQARPVAYTNIWLYDMWATAQLIGNSS